MIAGVCHDYAHDGNNNTYHVNAITPRAIRYMDVSIQESYHAAESFQLMRKPENNFLDALKIEDLITFKKRMMGCILATDMAKHAEDLTSFKLKLETNGIKGTLNNGAQFLDKTSGKTLFAS